MPQNRDKKGVFISTGENHFTGAASMEADAMPLQVEGTLLQINAPRFLFLIAHSQNWPLLTQTRLSKPTLNYIELWLISQYDKY